ncbi:uncharacterized protein LOC111021483 [Momordica charantia]|uniref:Uncharacterized protein LOC111021483 n=1 Tax=Momordica charantia TaxID=3673 RepID=A0A6J1DL98_MOMCH|nr:uncharacterized protein LOC111021483 [Momordica charantia]
MVRTYRILPSPVNPRPENWFVNQSGSPPLTAGLFAKAPVEPTNHSKFTGKCSRPRHSQTPIMIDVVDSNSQPELNMFNSSASRTVDHLSNNDCWDGDEDDHCDHGNLERENLEGSGVQSNGDDDEMGFCHVELVLNHALEHDQEWCLVGENEM